MKILQITLLIIAITASAGNAQVKNVRSDVYNWNDLKALKSESVEDRLILEGSTEHFEYIKINAYGLAPKKSQSEINRDDLEELIIVKEGTLKTLVNGQHKVLGPGGVALISPDDIRTVENTGTTEAIYYSLKFRSKTSTDPERGKKAGGSAMLIWEEVAFEENPRGGRRQFFDRPTCALTRLEMHTTKLNEGLNSHEPHTHPEEEVVILLSGEAEMQIGEEHTKVFPGGLIFLDSMVPHAITNIGKGPCEYFAFSMRPFNKK